MNRTVLFIFIGSSIFLLAAGGFIVNHFFGGKQAKLDYLAAVQQRVADTEGYLSEIAAAEQEFETKRTELTKLERTLRKREKSLSIRRNQELGIKRTMKKAVKRSARFRLYDMSPRRWDRDDKPASIRYDLELHGDAKQVARLSERLFAHGKAMTVIKFEVSLVDFHRTPVVVKATAEFYDHATPKIPSEKADAELPENYRNFAAAYETPEAWQDVETPEIKAALLRLGEVRAEVEGRESDVRAWTVLQKREAALQAWGESLDQLSALRDASRDRLAEITKDIGSEVVKDDDGLVVAKLEDDGKLHVQ